MQIEPSIKLFCFPYAGGSASAFASVTSRLSKDIQVTALELPGRGNRRNEPLCTDMQQILDELFDAVTFRISGHEKKVILWGHSMGALVAFFLARKFKQAGVSVISDLIVSSMKGPSSISVPEIPLHQLPKMEFLEKFSSITSSGRNFNIYQNSTLIDFIEPVLRADIAAIEKCRYPEAAQLDIPITVIAGQEDKAVMEFYHTWQKETIYPLKSHEVKGGHFFLLEDSITTAEIISGIISEKELVVNQ
jgi:medium-chain acyl-[acyl-carrier-protein] hydrolase